METFLMRLIGRSQDGGLLRDAGKNLSGRTRLTVRGKRGTGIRLIHGERLSEDKRDLDLERISVFSGERSFQTDVFFLSGSARERFEPKFCYHGFRYVKVPGTTSCSELMLEARSVFSDLPLRGGFVCENEIINSLHACFLRSYTSNFVGFPTDCPHREKRGWTADAHLVCRSGLWNFKAETAYEQWIRLFPDEQRDDGCIPAIIPNSPLMRGGPGFEVAILLIPYRCFLHIGNSAVLNELYTPLKRYDFLLEYVHSGKQIDGIGDRLPPRPNNGNPWKEQRKRVVSRVLISDAFSFHGVKSFSRIAVRTDAPSDSERSRRRGIGSRRIFQKRRRCNETCRLSEKKQEKHMEFSKCSGFIPVIRACL